MPCDEASANPTGTLEPEWPLKESKTAKPLCPHSDRSWDAGCLREKCVTSGQAAPWPLGKVSCRQHLGRWARSANPGGVWTHPTLGAWLQLNLPVASQVKCLQLDC